MQFFPPQVTIHRVVPNKNQADYPGLRVGPEPTTDKFVAIMAGPSRQQLPGQPTVEELKVRMD